MHLLTVGAGVLQAGALAAHQTRYLARVEQANLHCFVERLVPCEEPSLEHVNAPDLESALNKYLWGKFWGSLGEIFRGEVLERSLERVRGKVQGKSTARLPE